MGSCQVEKLADEFRAHVFVIIKENVIRGVQPEGVTAIVSPSSNALI